MGRPARRLISAVAAAGALAAAGCGGGQDPAPRADAPAAKPVGIERAGSTAQFADCGDWRAASRAERFATIEAIRGQFTPQRSRTAASPLPDERAYAVFQKVCRQDYAESLRLYKLYVKVQGFAPLAG